MDKIHLRSPKNWINDPNGFIYYKGKYHLFYQHFPYEPRWGTMHWGHAVSDDLVSWEHKDIALFPSKSADRNGCFSGSAVEHDGKMYIYYTGVRYLTEDPEDIHTCPGDNFASSQMMIISDDGERFDNMNRKSIAVEPIEDTSIGSRAYYKDIAVYAPSFSNVKTIEKTGAGDTFTGCMLSFFLDCGVDDLSKEKLKELLIFANAGASLITSRNGALKVMPERKEIEALIKAAKP